MAKSNQILLIVNYSNTKLESLAHNLAYLQVCAPYPSTLLYIIAELRNLIV